MYGLVLMAALSTAPTTVGSDAMVMSAAPVMVSGCTGSSCAGSMMVVGSSCFGSSCTGSSCYSSSSCFGSSCHSSSCYSSCHGSLFPLFPGLRSRITSRFSCHGSSCHSSCYSSSCYSSCHSSACYGSSYRSSCTGSCYSSSCHGSSCTGCYSAAVYYGQASFAPTHGMVIGSSLAGDASGCFSVGSASYPTITINNTDTKMASAQANAAPARITVELPASAKLYVDGVLKTAEGTLRNFHTPDLSKGQSYYYDLKAEMTIDGATITDEKRVIVKAGESLNESFPKMLAALKTSKTTELAKK